MQVNTAQKTSTVSGALNSIIELSPLKSCGYDHFVRDYQRAFLFASSNGYKRRKHYPRITDEIIPEDVIKARLKERDTEAYRIMIGDAPIGGAIIHTEFKTIGVLDLLFIAPCAQNCGIGRTAWETIEKCHPDISVWETSIAFFERRNLHFLVNRCGFHIAEYFNRHQPNLNAYDMSPGSAREEAFRLEKAIPDPESLEEMRCKA